MKILSLSDSEEEIMYINSINNSNEQATATQGFETYINSINYSNEHATQWFETLVLDNSIPVKFKLDSDGADQNFIPSSVLIVFVVACRFSI